MRLQRCKDRAKQIKAHNNHYLTYHIVRWRLQFV
nr:MAG TPA: hypothetical protein [Caudoviricetes sp.]